MNTSLPFLPITDSPETSSEILILGQNILIPSQAGLPPQYAAAIYFASAWKADAPAAGLVIKTAFSRPMLPSIRPGNQVWEQFVAPHFERLLGIVSHLSTNPKGLRLGGVADQISALVKRQSNVFTGNGALLFPEIEVQLPAPENPRYSFVLPSSPSAISRPAAKVLYQQPNNSYAQVA